MTSGFYRVAADLFFCMSSKWVEKLGRSHLSCAPDKNWISMCTYTWILLANADCKKINVYVCVHENQFMSVTELYWIYLCYLYNTRYYTIHLTWSWPQSFNQPSLLWWGQKLCEFYSICCLWNNICCKNHEDRLINKVSTAVCLIGVRIRSNILHISLVF